MRTGGGHKSHAGAVAQSPASQLNYFFISLLCHRRQGALKVNFYTRHDEEGQLISEPASYLMKLFGCTHANAPLLRHSSSGSSRLAMLCMRFVCDSNHAPKKKFGPSCESGQLKGVPINERPCCPYYVSQAANTFSYFICLPLHCSSHIVAVVVVVAATSTASATKGPAVAISQQPDSCGDRLCSGEEIFCQPTNTILR